MKNADPAHIVTSRLLCYKMLTLSGASFIACFNIDIEDSPRSGDIRLSGGSCSGNLQVYVDAFPYGERWYQVCDRNLGNDEAEVICRQLGCPTEHAIRRQASFGFYSLVFYVSRGYECNGSESSLSSCSRDSGACISSSVNSDDDNDHVAIRCQTSSPSRPSPPGNAIGNVRLSAGCSGELQVYEDLHNGEGWYSVCESGFSDADSQVVCRNLGCPVNGATSTMSTPVSSLSSLRAHFYCVGSESSLSQCLTSLGQCSSTMSVVNVRCGGAVMLKVSIITLVSALIFILSLL